MKSSVISSCSARIKSWFNPVHWKYWLTRRKWEAEVLDTQGACWSFCPNCEYIEICMKTTEEIKKLYK